LFVAVALSAPWIGSEPLSLGHVWEFMRGTVTTDGAIFFYQRLPRVCLGLLAGGTLALVGASFQVLFRNPLVEPYTLGVSGGAALGAFLAISIPGLWLSWGPFGSVQLGAALGAGAALLLIFRFSRRAKGLGISTLLLAGVTLSIICSSAIMFITYLVSPHKVIVFQRWMMGGVDVVGFQELASLFPLLLPGLWLIARRLPALNHLTLGDDLALSQGVELPQVQRDIFFGGGLATAAVVALVGPIGFIGLIIPHGVRRLSGYDQRLVLPGSFLLGGAVLALCDTLARTLLAPTEIPVGVITAILGGPLFIALLMRRN
jgi:iron complex transport system permease protein